MKALILSAGFGTRLLPYTQFTPKPLFTLNRRPVLELAIDRMRQIGCDTILINTHHGHEAIENFIAAQNYGSVVTIRFEEQLMGTGGAVRNMADLWLPEPLLIYNADIITDIDLKAAYEYHINHPHPVTMIMHDHERFNSVVVDEDGFICGFIKTGQNKPQPLDGQTLMAFTGIHIIDPAVLEYVPPSGPADIIAIYQAMLRDGRKIQAWTVKQHYWEDIGTPESYRAAAIHAMAPEAFHRAFNIRIGVQPDLQVLQGDGSDRRWFRLQADGQRLIMADHGIHGNNEIRDEVDAFITIGTHLYQKGAAIPRIVLHDSFSGIVFLEDLGDMHLQQQYRQCRQKDAIALYRRVIDDWLDMALSGLEGFDPAWTYQTESYDRWVIIEKECRYFNEAFVQNYLGLAIDFESLAADFNRLVDLIQRHEIVGFMHRDLQSRNIMIKDERPWFIDFQGGRLGPLQYDLASLLIDPYTALPWNIQEKLAAHTARAVSQRTGMTEQTFLKGYDACAVSRNLQILGAFAFLSRVKGKNQFETYIPTAVKSLHFRLTNQMNSLLPDLQAVVTTITNRMGLA